MRLGGPVFNTYDDPRQWIALLRREGYTAAFCPVDDAADAETVAAYARAAEEAGIVIAEVGAWSNPLSPDATARAEATELCCRRLALADAVGARCCVNIAGSRGPIWHGPCAEDLTPETFDMIVEMVRNIIDTVQPRRTFYTLETMQWMYPDSADSYLALLRAVDREHFAVHFDPVNLVNCPARYFYTGAVIRDFTEKLGPYIKSCHAKDVRMGEGAIVHLDESRPGTGNLDYRTFLQAVHALDTDMPVMLEHLPSAEEYRLAAGYVREVATAAGVSVV